jgi:hypothetical protein
VVEMATWENANAIIVQARHGYSCRNSGLKLESASEQCGGRDCGDYDPSPKLLKVYRLGCQSSGSMK